ncbi:FAD/NAD(P)-binding protein [Vitiosangium sp. GDMCC 1.1324]|uniref:FAD/NAD(P)-binding protein n=1 Tax=Vitiosangium sp. (strain GDMCC 1.1324) TaxID=2138576 RepID=UPI000D38A416|nr:FAD/NAD(P)-binding protein [Vitiosangium sp. GDMCC 1.1324]PTL82040.1 hydroxyacylglutathione hydrolase [Vitiosangium sp. GDMCC 1.1324]
MRIEQRRDVLIVGGGASGTLLAAQLLRNAPGPLRVALLERTGRVGPGLAYSTESESHLLNVPAGRMSAFPDEPEHFLRWIRRIEPDTQPGDFVQRRRYGQYLEAVLREAREAAAPGVDLELLTGEASSLSQVGDAVRVVLATGPMLEARTVVLAVGNALPADLPVEDGGLYRSSRYIRSPWAEGALQRVQPHHSVLLVGTGLTMVDTVLSLAERNHEGRIHAISRHGLLPHVHRPGVVAGPAVSLSEPLRVRSVLRALRREARSMREGADWRGVVDALRPMTASVWRGLPEPERRRFLRHLRSFWDVHRHRMAPGVYDVLQQLRIAGVLRIHAARVRSFQVTEEGWVIARVRARGFEREATFRVQHVINCTGPDASIGRGHPLLRGLLESGLVRSDALGLGLATDAEGALLDAEGQPSGVLFTLGPLRRGDLWESTAIPEIRAQALGLARRLLEQLASRSDAPGSAVSHPPTFP